MCLFPSSLDVLFVSLEDVPLLFVVVLLFDGSFDIERGGEDKEGESVIVSSSSAFSIGVSRRRGTARGMRIGSSRISLNSKEDESVTVLELDVLGVGICRLLFRFHYQEFTF